MFPKIQNASFTTRQFLKKNIFLKSMFLKKEIFLKSTISEKKFFSKANFEKKEHKKSCFDSIYSVKSASFSFYVQF